MAFEGGALSDSDSIGTAELMEVADDDDADERNAELEPLRPYSSASIRLDGASKYDLFNISSSSSSSSSSSCSWDEDDLQEMIDLIEEEVRGDDKLKMSTSLNDGDIEMQSINDSHEGTGEPDVIEYWSVGKGDTPKILLKRFRIDGVVDESLEKINSEQEGTNMIVDDSI